MAKVFQTIGQFYANGIAARGPGKDVRFCWSVANDDKGIISGLLIWQPHLGLPHFQKFGMLISGKLGISSQLFWGKKHGKNHIKPHFHLHAEATSTNERLQSSGDVARGRFRSRRETQKLRWDGWDIFELGGAPVRNR